MMLEVILLLEFIAFAFLALGIMPFKRVNDSGNLPLANKLIFVLVSAIIFFSLGVVANTYEYVYCFVNETVSNITTYTTLSNAMCTSHLIESIGLAYLNFGMGMLAVVIGIIIMIITIASRHDTLSTNDDE